MNVSAIIENLLAGVDLSYSEMQSIMRNIMTGKYTDSQVAAFLVALRAKSETVDEISAAAQIMRELSTKINITAPNSVDMVGTGGDSTATFNISTAASVVIAASGATVAKHGNRSVSSKSGSADLLEVAGVKIDLPPQKTQDCINEIGLGFMFAPIYHSAMKYAITARKEVGIKTIFNLLGPLTNPASVKRQLTGVFSEFWLEPIAQVLKKLGSEQAMIVHSEDGMDEISISAATKIVELKNGKISSSIISPEDFGFKRSDIKTIQVKDAQQSLALIMDVLNNNESAAKDVVCLNAGATIYVAGKAETIFEGVQQAQESIANGSALAKLNQLIKFTNS